MAMRYVQTTLILTSKCDGLDWHLVDVQRDSRPVVNHGKMDPLAVWGNLPEQYNGYYTVAG